MPPAPPAVGTNQPSTAQMLAALQNVVTALNNATQTYLNVNGTSNLAGISTPTLVKASAGRVVNVSVVATGSYVGQIYDASQLGMTTRPLYVIPAAIGLNEVNLPAAYGILITPGTDMEVTVSFS